MQSSKPIDSAVVRADMRVPSFPTVVLAVLLLASLPAASAAELEYVWEDAFSHNERDWLGAWVEQTGAALESLVGPFPMTVRVHFHRRDRSNEPVPWANTRRGDVQGVHFYIDPTFGPRAFEQDWTAPHELAHLILPYVGPRHAWFAEGFASYLQFRVMQAMGVIDAAEAHRRLRWNLDNAARSYDYPDEPFARAARRLRAEHRYPVMYWGGAAYFLQVDAALTARGSSLIAVLQQYMACCRRNRDTLDGLLRDLDRLSGSDLFDASLATFRTRPGFPDLSGLVDIHDPEPASPDHTSPHKSPHKSPDQDPIGGP
mgnify:CR=1 FL=1